VGLAAVYAAWDFGRCWLVSLERAKEAALIRANESLYLWKDEIDVLRGDHGDAVTAHNARIRELIERVSKLENAPAPEAPDVSELREAIATQEKAFKNFWEQIGKQFTPREELKAELDKLRAGQAAIAATGGNNGGTRFRTART
jgi:chromosome segregation ATPase